MVRLLIVLIFICSIADAAVNFSSGSSEYLTQADGLSTDISGANQSLTLSAWVNFDSDTNATNHIVTKYDTGANQRQYTLAMAAGGTNEFSCTLSEDGTAASATATGGTTTITTGTWYGIACVYNDTDIRVYLDGSLDSSGSNPQAYTAGIHNGSAAFHIASRLSSGSPTGFDDGTVSDVCVWDTALSANEIAQIHNARIKGICRQIQSGNLQLYCSLESCVTGANCSSDFRCTPGSNMTPTNTPLGQGETYLSYP